MAEQDDILDPGVKDMPRNDGQQGDLPNAVATLVLGILSIIGCFFAGIPGVILGIIALILHQKDRQLYESDKSFYAVSWKTANGGKVCAIIGLSLSALYALIFILALINGGGSFYYSSNF
ncbi:MAG: CCC motif membrane protein [bacterium]|nr:CCC motif membrane protein [bacterium]